MRQDHPRIRLIHPAGLRAEATFRERGQLTCKVTSNPIGIGLHRLLNDYADQLDQRIDAGWRGDETSSRVAERS